MQEVLITGVSGFVGTHLTQFLASKEYHVVGFDRRRSPYVREMFIGDLTDPSTIIPALEKTNPQIIFHLAGILKSDHATDFFNAHVLGTLNLFESVRHSRTDPIVVVASSSAVYGRGYNNKRLTEKFTPRPITMYAVSKLIEELVALSAFRQKKIPVICLRSFNLLGPGLSKNMVCSALAKRIAEAEINNHRSIRVGNLSSRRDFLDVRDAVSAYELAARKCKQGQIYNICSGKSVTIQECLETMLTMATRSFELISDRGLIQKDDVPAQVGSHQKIHMQTGWRPHIRLEESLERLLNDWRRKVKPETREE